VFVIGRGETGIQDDAMRVPIFASDFGRYQFAPTNKWNVIFPYVERDGVFRLYTERELHQLFQKAFAYLCSRRDVLRKRVGAKVWYGFSAARSLATQEHARILVPLLAETEDFAH
jgi:hypothetical protein